MTKRFRVYIAQPRIRFYMLKGRAYASVMANYLTDIGAAEATHARVAVVESETA